jgi:hypothetical protein
VSAFDLLTKAISIGDPVMRMAEYKVSLEVGRYTLAPGALRPSDESNADGERIELIDLDAMYLYVVDSSKRNAFEKAFHEMGNECNYMMYEIEERHSEIEEKLGVKIGFYWEADVTSENCEGQYFLDVSKIEAAS